jgi:hypothetical protein
VLEAADGSDQLHELIGKAEEQLQSLSRVVPARPPVALLCHRRPFCLYPAGLPSRRPGRQSGPGADHVPPAARFLGPS